jgi:hypothetical protein
MRLVRVRGSVASPDRIAFSAGNEIIPASDSKPSEPLPHFLVSPERSRPTGHAQPDA